ncbi:MAG: glycerol-3-phosphate dehydrogenase/oxidase [Flavobacterium sp.]|nr:MAG: glycerol-3-phosphate dehydrogenase/oxidase [Flavobacterium sp.]
MLSRLETVEEWDLIIIGGGASGLGIAVDAVTRGFKTLLVEQYDFAKGTSSKSTKLLHGGVRYLAQGNLSLVIEALEERGLLALNARHLFIKQEFIIPNFNWWGGYFYAIGLKFYDLLSKKLSLGSSKRVGKEKVQSYLPTLKRDKLVSGVSYFDGQFDDARLALNLAQTAIEHGGTALNYMKVTRLLKNDLGKVCGVRVVNTETDRTYLVKGKVVINATGIFTDKILKMQDPNHKKTVVPSQGIHLVLDRSFLESDKAIMIPKTSDGRVLFVIPWHDKVIAGTTDTLIKKPKIEPVAQETEIDFILETINTYLAKNASRRDVLSVFSGLRPLAKPRGHNVKTKEVSRRHKIIISGNLLSIVGGKWTTYRKMAEDVVDNVIKTYRFPNSMSVTREVSIHGNISPGKALRHDHLFIYGSEVDSYLQFEGSKPEYKDKIHPEYPYTVGQVVWSIRYEMARTVEDFLARRIRLLLLDARAAMASSKKVSEIMAEELGKDQLWAQKQEQEFFTLAKTYVYR